MVIFFSTMTAKLQPIASMVKAKLAFVLAITVLGLTSSGCNSPDPVNRSSSSAKVEEFAIPEDPTALQEAVERGEQSFYNYGCWHCHAIGDDEPPGMRNELAMGPDLVDVGSRLKAPEIHRSIMEPNAVIAEPREQHMTEGVSKMPAFADPSARNDIRDMVVFLHQCRQPVVAASGLVEVTEKDFEQKLADAQEWVLLDFWAEWCFACRIVNPALEKIAPEFRAHLSIFKIEVDESPELVEKYVPDRSFPCLVILKKDGTVIARKYGMSNDVEPTAFLRDWLGKVVKAPNPR